MNIARKAAGILLRGLLTLAGAGITAWGALALGYRLPWPAWASYAVIAAWCLCGIGLLVVAWRPRPWRALLGYAVMLACISTWWATIKPSNARVWADDVAQMSSGRIEGNRLTMNNVRNFDWRAEDDYRARWETRSYDLDRLASVDLITSYWGMPAIAHVLVSFGFDDGQFLLFSVETRKEKGEGYSEVAGFFKQYELSILATDEHDALGVRTQVRGEDDYLYRVALSAPQRKALLVSYIEQANELLEQPRFYNTVTANCTTIVFDMMNTIVTGLPMDYRLLLTGYLPSYVDDVGGLQPGYSLQALRDAGRITERAKQASAAAFSVRIRQGVPGW
ncbi:DUF4105 domain-containing protein [Pseudomonas typographi]|uniref:Lnb N-terminal periplasmic domain-containing protein n=1 Tax=Pseudomonas typographi TaxID=2715964 RepID=UPI0016873439|nr:DUF4105 domain-containing protein [Pseudomonas typographi]MBD1552444.1 DUF4105 domain-containing protein [Pseudomonas typographi]